MAERLGRYTLGACLGRGGQGAVYEAVQEHPVRRRVALKVMDGDDIRREARIAALLRHPHLVDVYEVGREGPRWYCAMELCEGGSLAGRLAMPPRAVVDVGLQICRALAYAHRELELVHLDLKPGNLLLQGGAVKVADLGIARARGFDSDRKKIRGTPRFMAPEQRVRLDVDTRADVYATGKVLKALTLGGDVDDDVTLLPGDAPPEHPIPDWLQAVVERCIAPDPADRFQDMAELGAALDALAVPGPSLREWSGATAEPASLLPFVGRQRTLAELERELGTGGLVTLKGPGGMGKSRLGLQWARGAGFPVHVVDATDVPTAEGLTQLVARALGLPDQPDAAARERLVGDALAGRGDVGLVLDTLEHLVGQLEVLERWLQARSTRILATSRVALGLATEHVIEVPPMGHAEAIQLLETCARRRGAEVGGDPVLAELADRLDGLPLALELAAGRMGVLSPAEVLQRLDLSLLRSGQLGLSPRQATVQGTLDWSWSLLEPADREALAQLSMFRGSATDDDVVAVVALSDGSEAHRALERLQRHSLVVRTDGRSSLLAMVRQYAGRRLDVGDRRACELRHGAWFARLGQLTGFDPSAPSLGPEAWAQVVPNLVAAAERALARDDGETAGRVVLALVAAERDSGDRAALIDWLGRALVCCPPSLRGPLLETRADLLSIVGEHDAADADLDAASDAGGDPVRVGYIRGWLHLRRHQVDRARESFDVALAHGESRGRYLAALRLRRAIVDRMTGDFDLATARIQDALQEARRCSRPTFEVSALMVLGDIDKQRGRVEQARDHYAEGLALADALGLQGGSASHRINLGRALWALDELEQARPLLLTAVAQFRRQGTRTLLANGLVALADLELAEGRFAAARVCIDEGLAIHRGLHDRGHEGFALAQLARLHAQRGELDQARSVLEQALALHEGPAGAILRAFDRVQLAEVELRADRPEVARAHVTAAFPAIGFGQTTKGYALAVRGEAAARCGDLQAARDDLDAGLALLRTTTERPFLRGALCAAARALGDPALLAEATGAREWAPGSSAQVELSRTAAVLAGRIG